MAELENSAKTDMSNAETTTTPVEKVKPFSDVRDDFDFTGFTDEQEKTILGQLEQVKLPDGDGPAYISARNLTDIPVGVSEKLVRQFDFCHSGNLYAGVVSSDEGGIDLIDLFSTGPEAIKMPEIIIPYGALICDGEKMDIQIVNLSELMPHFSKESEAICVEVDTTNLVFNGR